MKSTDKGVGVSAQTTRTKYDGVLLTIRSRKSFFEVTHAIESDLQPFHIPKLMEYVTHGDRAGVEAYVRICVSQRDGEEKRIDMDLPSAFFSKFPEARPSSVPALLDEKLIKLFEDAAA